MFVALRCAFVLIFVLSARSAPADDTVDMLKKAEPIISTHAKNICGTYKYNGASITVEAEGGAKISLGEYASYFQKILKDAGISVSGQIDAGAFTNVVQESLPTELKSVRACSLEVWRGLTEVVFRKDRCEVRAQMKAYAGYNLLQLPGYNLLKPVLRPAEYLGCEAICLRRDDCTAFAFRQIADGDHQQECHLYGEPRDKLELAPYSVITSAFKEQYLACSK